MHYFKSQYACVHYFADYLMHNMTSPKATDVIRFYHIKKQQRQDKLYLQRTNFNSTGLFLMRSRWSRIKAYRRWRTITTWTAKRRVTTWIKCNIHRFHPDRVIKICLKGHCIWWTRLSRICSMANKCKPLWKRNQNIKLKQPKIEARFTIPSIEHNKEASDDNYFPGLEIVYTSKCKCKSIYQEASAMMAWLEIKVI